MNTGDAQDGGTSFGHRGACLQVGGVVVWSVGVLLLAVVVVLGGKPALGAPGDYEVEAFSGPDYTGKSEVFTLDPKENQVWARFYMGQPWIVSLKVGKKVGVLLQKEMFWHPKEYPDYIVLTEDKPSLSAVLQNATHVMIFNKGANLGVLPGGKVKWGRPWPDGVLMSRYSSNTLFGGTDPDVPHYFYSPFGQYPSPYNPVKISDGFFCSDTKKHDLHWARIWGKTTYLKIRDKVGHTKTYTTDGKDEAEYDLSGSIIFQNLVGAEVGTLQGGGPSGAAADPAASRGRWEFKHICFRQFAKGTWVEFQSEKPTYWFSEVERKPEYVELLDKDRNMRVRLYGDRISMLNPGSNPNYVPFYSGGGWRDTRDYWLVAAGRFFKKAQGNSWEEFQGGKKVFSFTESQRTPESVELHDASRNLWVQLRADLAMIRKDNAAAPWQPLGPGRWDFAEAPQKGALAQPMQIIPQPAILITKDLAGTWASNVGVEYHIQQSGMNFTWNAPKVNQSATGKFLSTNEVTAQWSGAVGNESATGKLTQIDITGKPTRIEWSNGVVFTRQAAAAPPAPSAPSLQATWVSNFGAVYHIKQSGMSFSWSAPKLNESGQGTMFPGNTVSAKWSGPGGSGSAQGKIAQFDAMGKPTRIEWNNGVVFTRK